MAVIIFSPLLLFLKVAISEITKHSDSLDYCRNAILPLGAFITPAVKERPSFLTVSHHGSRTGLPDKIEDAWLNWNFA